MLNYKGLKATFEHLTVDDIQVDRQIDRLLEQNRKTIAVSGRPTRLDDEVILNYTGYCDGEAFEGGTASKQPLTLGSGMFIPGFEEQLLGKNAGDEVDVHVTFPEKYPAANLAGKDATFHCTILEIRVHAKYEPDDTFAKEVGGCETFDAFKNELRAAMQAHVDLQADLELKDRLMNQLIENYDAEISDEQLKKAVDIEMRELEAELNQQKLTMELYCQFMNQTEAQVREDCIPNARNNILRQMIIAEIAKAESIEASEQDVTDAFVKLCRENNLTVEQLQPYFDRQMESALIRSIIEEKVMNLIRAHAVIDTVEK